ncbi:MAG: methyltransferase domain-containing protein, partial [Lentisphaerae bacterium]
MHTITEPRPRSVTADEPWQILMARRSFKKREKLHILKQLLYPIPDDWHCLDLGCARGSLSYFLRQWGGRWVSVDLDRDNVMSTHQLVHQGVLQVGPGPLPFRPASFDLVVSLEVAEHLPPERADSFVADLCARSGYVLFSAAVPG